jgi:hypothetical protein
VCTATGYTPRAPATGSCAPGAAAARCGWYHGLWPERSASCYLDLLEDTVEGTSFNAVREDVRRQLSRRYLDEGLSIAEISFLLGFSEPSAFFRAFKRWTGVTPLEARRAGS